MKQNSKTRKFLLVFLMALMLFFSLCAVAPLTRNSLPALAQDGRTPMYHVGVGALSPPVAGRLPDCEVMPDGKYTITVQWFGKEGDVFVHHTESEPLHAGVSYRVAIHLEALEGYYFDTEYSRFSCSINGLTQDTYQVIDETHIIIFHVYPALEKAPVEYAEVTVDAPRAGSTPNFGADVTGNCVLSDYNASGYVNGVFWQDTITSKVLSAEDTFIAGRTYRVQIVLKADGDHIFDNSSKNAVKINDKLATLVVGDPTPDANYKVAYTTLTVPKTISEINVKDFVAPVVGNTPDFWVSVDVDGVEVGQVSWGILKDVDGVEKVVDVDENHVFEDGATYMLCINLENKSDKTFALNDKLTGYAMTANVGDKKATLASWCEYDEHNVLQTRDLYNYVELQVWYTLKQEVIKEINIYQLPTPVAGEAPSAGKVWIAQDDIVIETIGWGYEVEENGGYKVVELAEGETFRKGVSYMVWFRLRNKGDAIFDYNEENKSMMVKATVNGKSANTYTVLEHTGYEYAAVDPYNYMEVSTWFRCNGEVVTTVDIGGVTAPVVGQTPSFDRKLLSTGYQVYGESTVYDFKENRDVYTQKNGVSWFDVTGDSPVTVRENDKFIGGHKYLVKFYTQAAQDCNFDCDNGESTNVIAYVNGERAEIVIQYYSYHYLTVQYTFECPIGIIDKVEFDIPDPAIGKTPCYDKIVAEGYHSEALDEWNAMVSNNNGLIWFETATHFYLDPALGDVFKENTDYSLGAYIVANEGYEFSKDVEVFINGCKIFGVFAMSTSMVIQNNYPITDCIHNIVAVAASTPTCTENGLIAHYECDKCHQMYVDEAGETLLDDGEDWAIIPALGHTFTDYVVEDGMAGAHKAICGVCGEEEVQDCVHDVKIIASPNEYAERDVMLYTCKYCDSFYFSPFESAKEEKESFSDTSTGVGVSFGNTAVEVPTDVTLEVEEAENVEAEISQENKEAMETMVNGDVNFVSAYDISFSYGDIVYVPTTTVTVVLPVDGEHNENDTYQVFYTDYHYTPIAVYTCQYHKESNTVSFETDHFSMYVLVRVEEKKETPSDSSNSSNGSDVEVSDSSNGAKEPVKKSCVSSLTATSTGMITLIGAAVLFLKKKKD